jgi:hypothetical protein
LLFQLDFIRREVAATIHKGKQACLLVPLTRGANVSPTL